MRKAIHQKNLELKIKFPADVWFGKIGISAVSQTQFNGVELLLNFALKKYLR